jgi:hypothetical protein
MLPEQWLTPIRPATSIEEKKKSPKKGSALTVDVLRIGTPTWFRIASMDAMGIELNTYSDSLGRVKGQDKPGP